MMKGKKIYSRLSILIVIILLIAGTQVLAAAPAKVIGVKANPTSTSVTVTWNSVSAIKGYEVEINMPGLGYVEQGQVKSTTKTITGLEPGKTYSVRVRAVRDSVTGPYSNEVRFTTPRGSSNSGGNSNGGSSNSGNTRVGTVSGVRANPGNTSVTVSWNRVSGASRYEVAINIPGIGYVEQRETNDTTQTITDLEPGTTYYVKVRAIGNGGYGSYSNEVRFTTSRGSSNGSGGTGTSKRKIQNVRITDVKETMVTFVFDLVSGANQYEIWVRLEDGGYHMVGRIDPDDTIILNGLEPGTKYYFKIAAFSGSTNIANSDEYSFTTPISSSTTGGTNNGGGSNSGTTVGQVKNVRVSNITATTMVVSWDGVAKATGYEVYVEIPGIGYVFVRNVNSTITDVTGFTPGTTYKTKIRAYEIVNGRKIFGSDSNEITFTTQK